MGEEINIIEKAKIPSGATMFFGFPDAGLVGVIAASEMIEQLKLAEVAYMDSKLLPPVIVLHEGLPHSTMRIFGDDKILLAISDIPVPADLLYPMMHTLIEWGTNKKVKLMISLSGIPVQDRQEAKELKAFAAASTPEALKMAENKGVEILTDGYMVGPQAIMLQQCSQKGIPALAMLAQCYLNYPDPEAAAVVLQELEKISGIKVNISKLLEKGEEIRLRARDVMKRTQQEMTNVKKGQEYDIPMYVS